MSDNLKLSSENLETLICPECNQDLPEYLGEPVWVCKECNHQFEVHEGVVHFTNPLDIVIFSKKREPAPEKRTDWKRANWEFVEEQLRGLKKEAYVLDVGSGRGEYDVLLEKFNSVLLEVYPYPEVDIVCDLTVKNPFRENSFDVILLSNVLEHVYEGRKLFSVLSKILKPDGILLVAVPFLIKLHQEPFDFVRYTHYALKLLGEENGLEVKSLEGYYDPLYLLKEGERVLKQPVLSRSTTRLVNISGRILLKVHEILLGMLRIVVGDGQMMVPGTTKNRTPTGYQVVYVKPKN